jgi:hypothetical protein
MVPRRPDACSAASPARLASPSGRGRPYSTPDCLRRRSSQNCDEADPADDRKGDSWDHVAIDAESRLVISVVAGERTAANVVAVVNDFKRRTGGRLMDLITTDGYPAYENAILDAYGETVTPPRTGKRGRPRAPYKVAPKGLTYAVVEKTREESRVVAIATRVVFGTTAAVVAALGMSRVSRSINTSFVERQNGIATPRRLARHTDSAKTGGITSR